MGWIYHNKPPMGWPINWDSSLSKGLIGCWLMNEGGGLKVFDLSGNGNTGTLLGGNVGWNAGKFGPTLDFPGTAGDYVTITPTDTSIYDIGPQGITAIVWAKVNMTGECNLIMHYGATGKRTWRIAVRLEQTRLRTFVDGALAAEWITCDWAVGEWHQVAITVTHTLSKLYSDGILVDSHVEDGAIQDSDIGIILGAWYDGSVGVLNGMIEHAMVFNRALCDSEISQLYREPFAMFKDPNEIPLLDQYYAVGDAGIMTLNTGYWGPTY